MKGRGRKKKDAETLFAAVKGKPLPDHVAVIMDGNGRWAKARHLPRVAGHRQGVEALREIITVTGDLGIGYLTLFAFSTENWKRPVQEVEALMSLLVEYLSREIETLHQNGIRIHLLGELSGLSEAPRRAVEAALTRTADNTKLQVNIAINYGSRYEIIKAVQGLMTDALAGRITPDSVDPSVFSMYLDTRGIPDPDLLIRTSGEYRLSNFLLYQLAYTELHFTESNIYWPDFDRLRYLQVLQAYQHRQRRYGGL